MCSLYRTYVNVDFVRCDNELQYMYTCIYVYIYIHIYFMYLYIYIYMTMYFVKKGACV